MSKTGPWMTLGLLALALVAGALLWARNSFASSPAASLANTHWSLVALNGQAPIAGRALTLTFQADGQLAGDSGCNSYGGRYQIQGSQIVVGQLLSTLRACAEQPWNDQEAAFQKALGDATQFNLVGDRLTLKNAAGSEELVLQKQ
jgi:heat shock protein HslJ